MGKIKNAKMEGFPKWQIFSSISYFSSQLNAGILFCGVGQEDVNTCKCLLFIPFSTLLICSTTIQ